MFWKEIPDDSADNLWVKNLVEITLSCTVSQIIAFLHFLQNFKMADKYGGNTIFGKNWQMTMQTPGGSTIWLKLLPRTIFEII